MSDPELQKERISKALEDVRRVLIELAHDDKISPDDCRHYCLQSDKYEITMKQLVERGY